MTTAKDLLALAEWLALKLSTKQVRECVTSLRGTDEWRLKPNGEAHRNRPYPMGFYPNDPNLYYAQGWGFSEYMFPHERWLVRRAAALRSHQENDNAE